MKLIKSVVDPQTRLVLDLPVGTVFSIKHDPRTFVVAQYDGQYGSNGTVYLMDLEKNTMVSRRKFEMFEVDRVYEQAHVVLK